MPNVVELRLFPQVDGLLVGYAYLRYLESRAAVALYRSRSLGGICTNAIGPNSL